MVREIGGKSYYWKFPSPCGEKVGINLRECLCRLYSCEWFPSPCGEKVGINIRGLIKLRIERGEVREVSVPLRGKGRDQHPGDTKRSGTANHVSVPLRGKGRDQQGRRRWHSVKLLSVSVPLRGKGRDQLTQKK